MKKKWYDYLWIGELLYFLLCVFSILFAYVGLIFFITPLLIAIIVGNKAYCNKYCGRGQLLALLGDKLKLSRNVPPPAFLHSVRFRYGFKVFFMTTMFGVVIYLTYGVYSGLPVSQYVPVFWVVNLPWPWSDVSLVSPTVAQFAYGFFGVMLTSSILGLVTMVLFRPRSWCVYCPMGTMTQGICKKKHGKQVAKGKAS